MLDKTISHYRILAAIGKGGMGVVYKAEDLRLGRAVALKFLPEDLVHDAVSLERFQREARAVSALNHPNICVLHDIDRYEDRPFLVMEYLEGQTVRERLEGRGFSLADALEVAIPVLDALDTAHASGIVHRDITPANIFLTVRGHVKILDFGLAKQVTRTGAMASEIVTVAAPVTSPGHTVGTVAYMSPEQARGEDLDARSDLFSFGVALYEMATGNRPFGGSTTALMFVSLLQERPAPPTQLRPDLPRELDRILYKALEKDLDLRYQSASDMRADLRRLRRDLDLKHAIEPSEQTAKLPAASTGPMLRYTTSRTAQAEPPGRDRAESSAEYLARQIKRHRRVVALAMALLVILAGLGVWLGLREKPLDSLAVLPFVNAGADPGTEYLSDGIAESIINTISQLPKISVRSFSSVARYRNKEVNPQDVGRDLNVRAVITGRLVRHGDDYTVSAELIDVRNNRQVWGSVYTRTASGLLPVQEQIAREISEKLRMKLTGEDVQRIARRATGDSAAYQLYLQGLYHWNKGTLEDLQQSIDFFGQAIQKDSRYALAYAGQADAYAQMADFNVLPAREVMPKVRSAAAKAIELDGGLAEAHTSLAWAMYHDWDWIGAEAEFRRAIELNPGYPTAHSWYADYLTVLGRFDEALTEMNSAFSLDSASAAANLAFASRFYYARQYPQAIEQCQKTLALDVRFVPAHVLLGRAYEQKGSLDQATGEFKKALELSEGDSNELAALGHAYAVSHQGSEARKILDQLKERSDQTYVQPMALAAIYIALGDKDQAFDWLQKAFEDRSDWLVYLKVDPQFDAVRSDPRYLDLERRVGLTK